MSGSPDHGARNCPPRNGNLRNGGPLNGGRAAKDFLFKILLGVVLAGVSFVLGRVATLQDNDRQTFGDIKFQEGVEIGRGLGAAEERREWLDRGAHIHPDRPVYRDPPGHPKPVAPYPGEGGAR